MKLKIYLLFSLSIFMNVLHAQVGIGNTSPNATLDVSASNILTPSNTDGVLIPRINAFPITNPGISQKGMLIFLNNTVGVNLPGFYYWDGISTWIGLNSTSSSDSDWFKVGTTTAPTLITDSMFHTGNIAIGKNTTNFPLDIFTTAFDTSINNTFTNNNTNTINKIGINNLLNGTTNDDSFGIYNNLIGTGTGSHSGTYNYLTGSGTGSHYGNYSYIAGSGTGQQIGTRNTIFNDRNGVHYGTLNTLNEAAGTGAHYGTSNSIGGGGTGEQYGVLNTITNTGNNLHYGVNNVLSSAGTGNHFGVSSTLSGAGTGTQYGINNSITNTADSIHFGVNNTLSGTGLGIHYGINNSLSGAGTGIQYGTSNSITNTSDSNHFGVNNTLSGTGLGIHYGINNSLSGTGTGIQYGTSNSITNSSNSNHFGVNNSLSGTGTGAHFGINNSLSGIGDGTQYGNYNNINNTGNGAHFGLYNNILSTGTGSRYGVYTSISNSGTANQFGSYTDLNGVGSGTLFGSSIAISNNGNGIHYGNYTDIIGTGNGAKYGNANYDSNAGSGTHYGTFSSLSGAGTGQQHGSNILISNTGNANHYANYSILNGSGSGIKYGYYNLIDPIAGGTHYGIYSEVLKAGTNYAGYFLGKVSIGTTIANNYIFPSSRGTVGQIMQTDGTGNVTWVAPTALSITETDPQVTSTTTNVIPKWNGTTLVDGIVTDDGTNIGVGIPPSAGNKLEVAGKTKTTNFQMTTGSAANAILQSDATGNATWVAPTSLSITETDPQVTSTTTNVIPKWNGTTLVDGIVTDDGTNVGVGIPPSAGNKLEVAGKTKTTNFQMTTGSAANAILQSDALGNASWQSLNGFAWGILGNTGTVAATNFIGTTDDIDFVIKRNGIRAGYLGDPTGVTNVPVFDRRNTSFGANSLLNPATGYRNTAIGSNIMTVNTTGSRNVAIGDAALLSNTSGIENTAIGVGALASNTTNLSNTAVGRNTLTSSTADYNTAIGDRSLTTNTTGTLNTGIGVSSLRLNTTGSNNSANGVFSLRSNTTGSNNTALGYESLYSNTTGSRNVGLGYQAGYSETTSDKLYIENSNADANNALVYGDFNANILRTNSQFQIGNPAVTGYALPVSKGTVGQILQGDGAGNTAWVATTTLAITETDPQVTSTTTNKIPKWNGTTLIDGVVTDDGTNVGVGIAPSAGNKLEVAGKTKTTDFQMITGATNGYVMQSDASGNASWVNSSTLAITETDPQVTSTTTNKIPKWNGTTLIDGVVTDDGTNVGVGIAPSAGNKLEVAGKTKTTNFQMITGANTGYVMQSDASGNASWVNSSTLAITETDPQVTSTTTNKIPKWNGTTLIDGVVTDDGTNVGVGIAPSAGNKLEVAGKTKTTNFQMTTGATTGYVMQSDASGNATWTNANTKSIVRTNISASQSLSNGGWQLVTFNTVVMDTNSEFNTGTSRFTATKAGYYQINSGIHTNDQTNIDLYSIGVRKNGAFYQQTTGNHSNLGPVSRNINCIVNLAIGDYIEIFVENYQPGVTVDGFVGKSFFEIIQVQ